jgi:hypothetical protein
MLKRVVMVGLLLMAASAWADSFSPPSMTGFTQIDSTSGSFDFTNTITGATDQGNYIEWVFQNQTTGTLDFVYQLDVTAGAVEHMTGSVYNCGLVTGMGTLFGASSDIAPSGENCNPISQTADFAFGSNMVAGATSQYLQVATSATAYGKGAIEFQDGANGYVQGFAPTVAAPEPASLGMLGAGLVGIVGMRRRRRHC